VARGPDLRRNKIIIVVAAVGLNCCLKRHADLSQTITYYIEFYSKVFFYVMLGSAAASVGQTPPGPKVSPAVPRGMLRFLFRCFSVTYVDTSTVRLICSTLMKIIYAP